MLIHNQNPNAELKNLNKTLEKDYENLSDYLYSRAVEEIAKKDNYFENLEIDEETKKILK